MVHQTVLLCRLVGFLHLVQPTLVRANVKPRSSEPLRFPKSTRPFLSLSTAKRQGTVEDPTPKHAASDWRDVINGGGVKMTADDGQYWNQPQVAQLSNGSWVAVLTEASFKEGQPNQRVVSRLHPSPDLADPTWLPSVAIEENPWGPSAGWAVPLFAPGLNRLYAIYTFNAENITTMPDTAAPCRCQLVGGQWIRYSDNAGATWSDRWPVPIRVTSIDRQNPWHGDVLQGWTVSKPIILSGGTVLLPFTKIGTYVQSHERQWVIRSENILYQRNFSRVSWSTWPPGDGGITQGCGPLAGDVAEEGGLLALGKTNVVFLSRTSNGEINECVSTDVFKTWTPRPVRYANGYGHLKNPRGPITARRTPFGDFVMLYFNNGWNGYSPATNATRNPYFLTVGKMSSGGDDVIWAQPEVVLYGRGWLAGSLNPAYNLGYPDIVADDSGGLTIFAVHESPPGSACNNTEFMALGGCGVSIHQVPRAMVNSLRRQLNPTTRPAQLVNRGLVLDHKGMGSRLAAPVWPNVNQAPGAITIEAWLPATVRPGDVVIVCTGVDTDRTRGNLNRRALSESPVVGLEVKLANDTSGALVVTLTSTTTRVEFTSQRGAIVPGSATHIGVVVDGGPQMIYMVINGRFADGGPNRTFGYQFFEDVGSLNPAVGRATCSIGTSPQSVTRCRAYSTNLLVSELISNFQAGPDKS